MGFEKFTARTTELHTDDIMTLHEDFGVNVRLRFYTKTHFADTK